jgi:glycosyltransferase involved in cell wall biosynthesis
LGQIDPGPEEERIVQAEHKRYGHLTSTWQPAPDGYWAAWREELALADRVIINSEWSRECLRREGCPEEKLEVVPLVYVAPAAHEGAQAVSAERSGDPFRILFLGQINLRKGIGRLLDAMQLLRDEPFELIMAGPSEINPSAWADLPNVHWMGPIARSEVSRVYRSADVFILPTLSDGFALTQLEAQAHGLPVIASSHCGAVVVPGVNGWILPDTEATTICQVLRAVRARQQLTSSPVGIDSGLLGLSARLMGPSTEIS